MLDIKLLRETPDLIRKDLEKRRDKEKLALLDKILESDSSWRTLKHEEDILRRKRNELSQSINEAKKSGKDVKEILEEAKKIPELIKESEQKRLQLEEEIKKGLGSLPNLMHESVPYGKDDSENCEFKKVGEIKKHDFELIPHQEVAEGLGGADFDRSAKISGAGFYFLKGDLALLNQAIIRFAIDHMVRKGYTYVEPPLMLNKDAYATGVSLEDFENVMYKIDGEEKFMIATAEHPLLAQFMNETIEEDSLPIKLAGYSMCFRREIGSRGIDTKGFFRTHQFNKVEQVILCKPEDSWKYHEELQKNAEELYEQLELPFRVVNICTGDLGYFAAKKYDIETWMARQNEYKETGSNSNYTDYQARRANIRMHRKKDNSYEFLHTLNNTAMATSRILVAILESYQNADGSLTIPKALRPYMYGKDKIIARNKFY
ncbi:MAG: serine--tRNA ligase [Candidatus Woesearchaeota archaeon]|jgi:seryl-tRNA synthetase